MYQILKQNANRVCNMGEMLKQPQADTISRDLTFWFWLKLMLRVRSGFWVEVGVEVDVEVEAEVEAAVAVEVEVDVQVEFVVEVYATHQTCCSQVWQMYTHSVGTTHI